MKILIATIVYLLITGCSSLHILKECRSVEGEDDKYVCKTLKPWE